jgi:hypothetical protein
MKTLEIGDAKVSVFLRELRKACKEMGKPLKVIRLKMNNRVHDNVWKFLTKKQMWEKKCRNQIPRGPHYGVVAVVRGS